MTCNHCAAASAGLAAHTGSPDIEASWAGNREHPHYCPTCRAFLRADGGCTRCDGLSVTSDGETLAAVELTRQEKAAVNEAESLARLLRQGGFDPLNNDGVRRLHANYVSISCGQDRQVVLDPTFPTAATDLGGQVYLNPYPLGPDGRILDQMVVAQSYIDHELLHELFTPREALDTIVAAAKGRGGEALNGTRWAGLVKRGQALSPAGRAIVKDMLNVLEDGRIERLCEQREPYMWGRMLAGQAIQPKDGHARNGGMARLKPYQQVLWAAQLEVQPNYTLTPDIRAGMTPEALQMVRDLRPLIRKAGHGTAYDAVEASLEIVGELDRRGLLVDGAAAKPPSEMSVHEAGGSNHANGEVAPAELSGDWAPDSDAGSEDSGSDSGGTDDQPAGKPSSGKAGSEDSLSSEDSGLDSDGTDPKADGKPAGDKAGSEDSLSSEDSGLDSGGTDPDKAGEQERCPDCGAFKTPGKPCQNCADKAGSEDSLSSEDSGLDSGGTDPKAGGKPSGDKAGSEKSVSSEDSGLDSGGTDPQPDDEAVDGPDNPADRPPSTGSGDQSLTIGAEFEETEAMRERQAELRRQAEAALEQARIAAVGDFRRAVKTTVKAAEKRLAEKVAAGPGPVTLPFIDHQGKPTTMTASTFPKASRGNVLKGYLEEDRAAIGQGANAMATALKKMRMEVEKTGYLKKKGDLDRRRITAALKGSDRIRMEPAPKRDLSMAVSVSVDRSGSMMMSARQLGTITGIVAKGLEKADIAYEVRSYSDDQYHHKTFAERKMEDRNLLPMYTTEGGNDDPVSITLGGLALTTRPESTKVQFVITDGEPACNRMTSKYPQPAGWRGFWFNSGVDEVKHAVRHNQKQGQLVQAIFYAKPSGKSREDVAPAFDYMYGPGNWAYVAELEDLPRVVTSTLTAQMAKQK
jgi:hypothetical protein